MVIIFLLGKFLLPEREVGGIILSNCAISQWLIKSMHHLSVKNQSLVDWVTAGVITAEFDTVTMQSTTDATHVQTGTMVAP